MKKIFILGAFALATLAFTSCDPNKEQCWKIIVTFDTGATSEYFYYGSGVDSDAQFAIYEKMQGVRSVRKEQTFLSKDNCHE